jgi:hypothetical protein
VIGREDPHREAGSDIEALSERFDVLERSSSRRAGQGIVDVVRTTTPNVERFR